LIMGTCSFVFGLGIWVRDAIT